MKHLILSFLLVFVAGSVAAQDDLYFTPKKADKAEKAKRKAEIQAERDRQRMEEEALRIAAEKAYLARLYGVYDEEVDAYNRQGAFYSSVVEIDSTNSGNDIISFDDDTTYSGDTLYNPRENYQCSKLISRFEDMNYHYNPRWYYDWAWYNDPWYDSWWPTSWHYSWHSPFYYGWNDPWRYYGHYGYCGYYGYYGWYDPWYSPWYYGGYYGGYWGAHWGRPIIINTGGAAGRFVAGTRNHGKHSNYNGGYTGTISRRQSHSNAALNARASTSVTRSNSSSRDSYRNSNSNNNYTPSNFNNSNSNVSSGSRYSGGYSGSSSGGSRGGGGGGGVRNAGGHSGGRR